jgi:hypothetical protein
MRRLVVLAGLFLTALLVVAGWQLYFLIAVSNLPPEQSHPMSDDRMKPATLPRR